MSRARTRATGLRLHVALSLLLAIPFHIVAGQTAAASGCAERSARAPATWSPPLDRKVTLSLRGVSLRDALDRLGAAVRLKFAYSSDFLPVDRSVCLTSNGMSVGDALATLLDGTGVEPIVVGDDRVVLAPSKQIAAPAPFVTSTGIGTLERVVITGSAVGSSQRPLTIALDIVSPSQASATAGSLSSLLSAAVPGMWVWGQAPSALLAHYGSIRGASSFGLSYPKIYIDGIEVANPVLITQIDPGSLERIEVIRGPQGAALYGADAISGVINIITRHDGVGPSGEAVEVVSTAGGAQSSFAPSAVFQQDHAINIRTGSNLRSADLSLAGSTMGAYIPDFASKEFRGGGALRIIGARLSLSATARLYAKNANISSNPLLSTGPPPLPVDTSRGKPVNDRPDDGHMDRDAVFARPVSDSSPQSVREYTVGFTGAFQQNDRWTHSLSMGVDGYRLSNLPNDFTPIPSAADSALRAARGAADRGTIRASTVGQFGSDAATLKVTVAAEQSTFYERTAADQTRPGSPPPSDAAAWTNNAGLVTQLDAGLRNRFFVTAGLRGERNAGATVTSSLLPMIGGAWVEDHGPVSVKLRTAYGRAIRPPQNVARQTTWLGVHTSTATDLKPEEQTGIEIGGDVFVERFLTVRFTWFDQRASGLIQPVGVVTDTSTSSGAPLRQLSYKLQNVGAIQNRGFEAGSSFEIAQLSVAATLSSVDSRVLQLASGYEGDLRPGDRILGVPKWTASATSAWTAQSWSASLAFARAMDWVNYDRLALATAASTPGHRPGGVGWIGASTVLARVSGRVATQRRGDTTAVVASGVDGQCIQLAQ